MSISKMNRLAQITHRATDNLDLDFIKSSKETIHKIIFKHFSSEAESANDKRLLSLVIDSALDKRVRFLESENPMDTADSLDDYMAQMDLMTASVMPNFRAFSNPLITAGSQRDKQARNDLVAEKASIIQNALHSYDKETNGNIVSLEYDYPDLFTINKDEYTVESDDSFGNMSRVVFDLGMRADSVRNLNSWQFAIDFENYGYLFDSKLNADLFNDLTAINEKIDKVSLDGNDCNNIGVINNNIGFAFGTLARTFTDMLSKDIEDELAIQGEEINRLAFEYLRNPSKEILNELNTLNIKEKEAVIPILIEVFEGALSSNEALGSYCTKIRESKLNSVDPEELFSDIEANVQEAYQYHEDGNTFMLRTKMKSLNVFEKAVLNLEIEHSKTRSADNDLTL